MASTDSLTSRLAGLFAFPMARKEEFPFTAKAAEEANTEQTRDKGNLCCPALPCSLDSMVQKKLNDWKQSITCSLNKYLFRIAYSGCV